MTRIWLIVLLLVNSTYSFSNMFITESLGLGYCHGGITGHAIRQISYEYLNVTTEEEFIEKLTIPLWTKHVAVVEVIGKFNDNVDTDPETKNNPQFHFDAERFIRGNNLLLTSQELILNSIRNGQYSTAREQLGTYLHTHQDFYSHSNWIEMNGTNAYKLLGEINAFYNNNVATINMSTCLNCQKPCKECPYECVNNIIPLLNQEKIFTSGYYVDQSEDGKPVPKPTNVLKCSHGNILDKTSDIPALGGINKDMKTSVLSPHYYNQEKAANAAIQSTYLFLKKLWHLTETKSDNISHFGRLLELVPNQQSLIFIIDLSNSMNNSIDRIKILVREILINVTSNKKSLPSEIGIIAFEKQTRSMIIKPYKHGEIDRLLYFLDSLMIMGDIKLTMKDIITGLSLSNDHCFAYIFTNEFNDDREVSIFAKRKNCHINFLLSKEKKSNEILFNTLNIQNNSMSSITSLITQTFNKNSIPILIVNNPISDLYSFYIDSSVEMIEFMINIESKFDIKNLFISPNNSFIDFRVYFGNQHMKIGQINKPVIGQWQFQVNSSFIKSFQIKLITSIQFEHSFKIFNTNLNHPGLYSINTEPIQGSSLYSYIRILQQTSQQIIFDELEFIDSSNHCLKQYKLIKHNDLIYTCKIKIPLVDFYIKIKGINHQNERIERLYSYKIVPQTLELDVIIDNNSSSYLKPHQQSKINFTLVNHNSHNLTIDVIITQSNPIFDIILNKNQFILKSNEKQTNYFQIKAVNNLTYINSSSEISIIASDILQSSAFNIHTLRANIISPLNKTTKSLICNSLFPSGKNPNEICKGTIDSCSSRYWDIQLNITDQNLSGIHSIILTYYDNKNILQSNKETIKYLPNKIDQFNLQLLLSPNNCCKKYADIIVYDQNGNRVNCMDFQKIGL